MLKYLELEHQKNKNKKKSEINHHNTYIKTGFRK